MERVFHVYFMAGNSGVIYLGVTSHLAERVFQHQQKLIPGFTKKYNLTKLVWFEPHQEIESCDCRCLGDSASRNTSSIRTAAYGSNVQVCSDCGD
jgi:hypothetical protein